MRAGCFWPWDAKLGLSDVVSVFIRAWRLLLPKVSVPYILCAQLDKAIVGRVCANITFSAHNEPVNATATFFPMAGL
jgi:hypothetical protein